MKIVKLLYLLGIVSVTISNAQTWEKIEMNFPPSDSLVRGANIVFATKSTGWISIHASDTTKPATQFFTWICKTTNGGKDWVIQKDISNNFNGYNLFTTDSLHCWAYDSEGKLIYTVDGGTSWEETYIDGNPTVYPYTFRNLYFFNNVEGIVMDPFRPWSTNDGGKSWIAGDSSKVSFYAGDISFTSREKGWLVSGATPYRSDGGI